MASFSCKPQKGKAIGIKDGLYLVVFDEPFCNAYEDFALQVNGNEYEKEFKSGKKISGRLERLSTRRYIFLDDKGDLTQEEESTELSEQISRLGNPIFELTIIGTDTMTFKTVVQETVIINKGSIVRLDR